MDREVDFYYISRRDVNDVKQNLTNQNVQIREEIEVMIY
jgi:hypothetical protein